MWGRHLVHPDECARRDQGFNTILYCAGCFSFQTGPQVAAGALVQPDGARDLYWMTMRGSRSASTSSSSVHKKTAKVEAFVPVPSTLPSFHYFVVHIERGISLSKCRCAPYLRWADPTGSAYVYGGCHWVCIRK